MKVLILANFGMGLYKFRKELLSELLSKNVEVVLSFPKDKYVPKLESLGCKYIETTVDRRGTSLIKDMKLLVSYIKLMKKEKPDVVLTYTIKPNIYGGIACQVTKLPYITNITGLGTSVESGGVLSKLSLMLYKIGLRKSGKVFFQNKANKNFFDSHNILTSPSKILPGSGVNLAEFHFEEYPKDSDNLIFLYIGRLMEAKGTRELFSVVKKIKKLHKNIEFHIVGFSDDDTTSELNDLVQKEIINYHGPKNDVKPFLKNCHAIIHPTHHEGMSNVLLEASAIGRPIIASNIPGCQEIFDEEETGFGFEVKNEESLSQAIEKFINLPYEGKKNMGYKARKKIETEFNRQIVIDEYMRTITKILGVSENEFIREN